MGEWINTTIGEQATLQRGVDITKVEQRPGTVPVISSAGVSSYHDTPAASGPGVVLGRKGVVGSVYFVESDYWPHDTTLWVKDFHGNDRRFVYYFFKWMAPRIASMDVGSANPTLNRNHVHPIEILWPPLPEQRAISGILGTLDDKIDLNRRINETLEAMARAIFKSWFIDFDPVRRNAARARNQPSPAAPRHPLPLGEGRGEGRIEELDALFPDRFEDSELGEIPAGWKTGTIGDAVTAVGGSTPSTKEPSFWDGAIHFATPKHMAALASPVLLDTERRITEKGLEQISSGLLPKGTVLLSSRAPIGYLAMAEIPVAVNQGIIAMICDKELPNYYVLHWAQENMETIIGNANGTTFLEISKKNFRPIKLLLPPNDVVNCFVQQVDALYQRLVANLRESHALVMLRDTLLPKLLSGEIRVAPEFWETAP